MPKHKALSALMTAEELRDCGDLSHDQHNRVMRIAEELQEIWQSLVKEEAQR